MEDWNQHRLLSRKEAAEFLGVKEITLAIWQSSRRYKLPVVKVGRLVKYRFGDLLDFVERRTVNQSTPEGKKASDSSFDNQ
ncbi:MAG: helix-turn-helix domain-containing protein [Alphaproteobacteria bacterium]|nr:helix-turn-helix domain-containing protein [Alphaproteobacteria bacterium]